MHTFFEAQRYYRHMSHVYYGLFMVAALVQFLVILLIASLAVYLITESWSWSVVFWVGVCLSAYFLAGFVLAQKRVSEGGISVAKAVKAVRLFVHGNERHDPVYTQTHIRVSDPKDLPSAYQRYHEFATQMAIASGIALPKLYVLPFESGVNGFVAGFGDDDRVMVMTQGALENLSNAELYGLLGHEFGHILHGDAQLNLRLYVVLTTLTWFYDLVDKIELLVLGRFDQSYHGDANPAHAWQVDLRKQNLTLTKGEWISKLQAQRRHIEHQHQIEHHSSLLGGGLGKIMGDGMYNGGFAGGLSGLRRTGGSGDEVNLRNLVMFVVFALPLLVAKILGVVAIAGAEWLKQQFNRQREYLADATSVQLTRSSDVVAALQSIQAKYSTALYNKDFSTCMSHFFFASPEADGSKIGMHSHPYLHERIDAVRFDRHGDFAKALTQHLDGHKLATAHDYALAYDYVQDSSAPSGDTAQPTSSVVVVEDAPIDFEAPTEHIIDGRLVVKDWGLDTATDARTLYPRQAPKYDLTAPITIDQLSAINLPWSITSQLTKIVGVISLLETMLVCRHYRTIDPASELDLAIVYTPSSEQLKSSSSLDDALFRHRLPQDLLSMVAHLDRSGDGLIISLCLKQLSKLLQQAKTTPITDKTTILLQKYGTALVTLVQDAPSFADKLAALEGLSFSDADFQDPRLSPTRQPLHPVYHACVCLTLMHALQDYGTRHLHLITGTRYQAIINWLGLAPLGIQTHDRPDHSEPVAPWVIALAALLALVAIAQDNSLAMRQYDKLTAHLGRWYRLIGVDANHLGYVKLIKLMYKIRALGVIDWLCILSICLPSNHPDTPSPEPTTLEPNGAHLIDTLHTAFVLDGKIGQEEYDLLNALAVMYGQSFVRL